jgi:hypothetical protein
MREETRKKEYVPCLGKLLTRTGTVARHFNGQDHVLTNFQQIQEVTEILFLPIFLCEFVEIF